MRAFQQYHDKHYDVIVVGAGIYGGVLGYQLARAGLAALVVDKGDFCGATSANSLKVLHGGLRYLQHADIKRMRESIISRRRLMRFSPHLTRPLGSLVPTSGRGIRSRLLMGMALTVNNLISFDRNRGLPQDRLVPAGKTIGKREMLNQVPGLMDDGLSGGALWYDGLAINSERLVLEHILAARDLGADIINYCQVERINTDAGAVTGISARDLVAGDTATFAAPWVVNAAGPWFAQILEQSGIQAPATYWAKAVNLVVTRPLNQTYAVGLEGASVYNDQDSLIKRGKRFFFMVPWRGGTMIGTTYQKYTGDPDRLQISGEDIRDILDELNNIYPSWGLRLKDVGFYHVGLVPMATAETDENGQVQLAKSSRVIDHRSTGGPSGLISIHSIKYTTAPVEAMQITRMIAGTRRFPEVAPEACNGNASCPTDDPRHQVLPLLEKRYGARAARVLAHVEGDESWRWWLSRRPDLLFAEIRYFVAEELAQTLGDVIFRRTGLGSFARPERSVLQRVAQTMAQELCWDETRISQEIAAVERIYEPLDGTGQTG